MEIRCISTLSTVFSTQVYCGKLVFNQFVNFFLTIVASLYISYVLL